MERESRNSAFCAHEEVIFPALLMTWMPVFSPTESHCDEVASSSRAYSPGRVKELVCASKDWLVLSASTRREALAQGRRVEKNDMWH